MAKLQSGKGAGLQGGKVAELQSGYEVRRCTNVISGHIAPSENDDVFCGLRFPVEKGHPRAMACPRCGTPTQAVVDIPIQREEESAWQPANKSTENTIHLELLLDNVRSLLNVGTIFRSADGVGVHHLHLCGITPTPDNPKLKKTALGAEQVLSWSQHLDGLQRVQQLLKQGHHLWALECPQESSYTAPQYSIHTVPVPEDKRPITLIVGHEVTGIDPQILALCEYHLYIPMRGIKRSLNVSTAAGVAIYSIAFGNNLDHQ